MEDYIEYDDLADSVADLIPDTNPFNLEDTEEILFNLFYLISDKGYSVDKDDIDGVMSELKELEKDILFSYRIPLSKKGSDEEVPVDLMISIGMVDEELYDLDFDIGFPWDDDAMDEDILIEME